MRKICQLLELCGLANMLVAIFTHTHLGIKDAEVWSSSAQNSSKLHLKNNLMVSWRDRLEGYGYYIVLYHYCVKTLTYRFDGLIFHACIVDFAFSLMRACINYLFITPNIRSLFSCFHAPSRDARQRSFTADVLQDGKHSWGGGLCQRFSACAAWRPSCISRGSLMRLGGSLGLKRGDLSGGLCFSSA